MRIEISADHVPPSQRAAYWREAVCRGFLPVETEPLRDAPVWGRLRQRVAGPVRLSLFETSPQSYRTTMPGADAVMLDIVLDGSVTIEQGAHTDVRPGSIGISDLRKPLVQRFDAKRRSRSLVAEIAQSEIGMDGPAPSVVHASDGIGHLIAGQAQLLFADCDQLDGPTRAVAGIALVSLVRHALSGVPKGGDRFSVRVRALLADHPSDAALDVDALARRLDVSRRTLFRHLAAEGTTPSHLLRDERLRKASAALALIAPSRSITAVALDHGFADHAHFSRAFKAKFGMTPTEFRKLRMAAFH